MPEQTLHAFYDLKVNPNCFDIVKFVALADAERRFLGLQFLQVVYVPGEGDGFREDDWNSENIQNKQWRLRQIMLPVSALLPSCRGVVHCVSRQEAHGICSSVAKNIFPKGYRVEDPIPVYLWADVSVALAKKRRLPSLKSPPQALAYVRTWLEQYAEGKKAVSITLREMGHDEERNSNLEAWAAFAKSLEGTDYQAVVLRDTEASFEKVPTSLDGLLMFPQGPVNLELRMALYELCHLNLTVSNGPIELCMFNRSVRFGAMKVQPQNRRREGLPEAGVGPEGQHPMNGPGRRWFWADDSLEEISIAFGQLAREIEEDNEPSHEQADLFPLLDIDIPEVADLLVKGSCLSHAEEVLSQLTDREADTHGVHSTKAELALHNSQLDKAKFHIDRAMELDDSVANYHHQMAKWYFEKGDLEAAAEWSEKSLELNDEKHKFHLLYGRIMERLGRIDLTIKHCREALRLGWDPGMANAHLGMLYESQGEFDLALACYQEVEKMLGANPSVLEWQAGVLVRMGRVGEARDLRMKAFETRKVKEG